MTLKEAMAYRGKNADTLAEFELYGNGGNR